MTVNQPSLPRLLSLATVVPDHRIAQADAASFSRGIFAGRGADFERLWPVYANAGIVTRYSSMPMEWLGRDRGWPENSRAYKDGALRLLERAAWESCEGAGVHPRDVDGLVVVSTTGVVTPSLDALLMERLPFRRDIARLPIFGLGCAGGVLGLARTAAMSRADPDSLWLFLVVELCCLTFRPRDLSKSNIIASALFGDGAAGAVISCNGNGPALRHWGEYTWPDSLDVMGWHIEEDGLGVLFSRDIPTLVRNDLKPRIDAFLSAHGSAAHEVDGWLFHPGGMKVLDALEEGLALESGSMIHARNVLRDFGNMSAATVLFVLKSALDAGASGRLFAGALGPGFTAGFLLLEHRP